jgi:hypothetical protein
MSIGAKSGLLLNRQESMHCPKNMPPPLILVGLVLLVAGTVCSRVVAERGLKLLSATEKLTLLDSFSRLRMFGGLPLLLVFLCFVGVTYLPPRFMWPAYLATWLLVAIYFAIFDRVVSCRLRKLEINLDYQKVQAKSRWLFYSGFLAFFILATLSSFVPK